MKKIFSVITILLFSMTLVSCGKTEGDIEINSIQLRYLEINDENLQDVNNERFSSLFEKNNPAYLTGGEEYLLAVEVKAVSNINTKRNVVFTLKIELRDFEATGADDIKGVSASDGKIETYSFKNDMGKNGKNVAASFSLSDTKGKSSEKIYYIVLRLKPRVVDETGEYMGNTEINIGENSKLNVRGPLAIGKSFNIGVR